MNSPRIKPLRVGVVGAGYWAKNMMRSIDDCPDTELALVADLDDNQLEVVTHRYPNAQVTNNAMAIVDDKGLDVIYIATPPATHRELAEQALIKSKHVLVEKPMTTSLDDAIALTDAAKASGSTLMVGHTFLYSSPVNKVREMIESGELGKTFYVDSQRVNLGKYQDSGVLWDLAPHDLSMFLYWFDELPVSVQASGRSFLNTGAHDASFITLHYPSGLIAHLQLSWLAPARLRRTTIASEKAMVVYDDSAGSEAIKTYNYAIDVNKTPSGFGESINYRVGDVSLPHLDAVEPLRNEWDHFVECIRYGKTPRSSAQTGIWVVAIIEAAERAMKSGSREAIEYPSWTLKYFNVPQDITSVKL